LKGPVGFSSLLKKASLAGAFFVSAIWLPGAQAFCPAPVGLSSVAVQRVVDGDTLRLSDGRSVRMIGLNTPELGKQGRSDRERFGGIWIELQDSLVLRVAPNLLGQFDSSRLQALKGKQIEARGWIVDRSRRGGLNPGQPRWLLPLTDPSMLQSAR
jgi:hypothetical protein